jgi:hypothetical protein
MNEGFIGKEMEERNLKKEQTGAQSNEKKKKEGFVFTNRS